jgi:putative restriction endonuclease
MGKEIILTSSHSIKSLGHLKQVVDFAFLDQALYELLSHPSSRALLKQALLSRYFPHSSYISNENILIQEVLKQMLNDSPATYRLRAKNFDEEELFVRGGIFKKEIPKIYNHTCCISGMRIIVDRQVQMVDACHIIPFSESGDDTVSNGISLCPNLHRAFDRGLLTITEDYKVQVHDFSEVETIYSIRQFDGKDIMLPEEQQYYPRIENLRAHHQRFGFG